MSDTNRSSALLYVDLVANDDLYTVSYQSRAMKADNNVQMESSLDP